MGLDVSWLMSGKPKSLYLDNAPEFKSEALRRGCAQHGIHLHYRPPGQPHYGGVVERIIGTAMKRIHELPGTTFSNPHQRRDYNSEQQAVFTLSELERWLTIAIVSYHGSFHSSLKQPPAMQWTEGVSQGKELYVVTNPKVFLIDFLPVLRRTLGRTGFLIDHIPYYADSLKPWIIRRGQLNKFIIRRDPRDISRIWVLDPEGKQYLEIPYRTLSNPAITLWEHKKAMAKLKEQGKSKVDEISIFRMITQMREITQTATSLTRKARRESQRYAHLTNKRVSSHPLSYPLPKDDTLENNSALPFEQIEEW
jgi:putative transposase